MILHNPNYPHNTALHALSLLCAAAIAALAVGCGPRWQLAPLEPAPPAVTGDSAMVVAAHPLAAEAGVSALRDGGNAVDAALAALFMLNIVEPHASGLGGGGFALVKMAYDSPSIVIYREKAPAAVDASFYYDPADSSGRLTSGGTAVCVPGAAAGWAALYDNWASMPLERLTRDAIAAAENGFPLDPTLAAQIRNNFETILSDSNLARTFLKDGLPYEVGDTLRQPELAQTLKYLTVNGLMSFYVGVIAETVVKASQAGGGFMSSADLRAYYAEIAMPVMGTYLGYDVISAPPPSRGGTALIESLNLVEATNANSHPIGSWESIHLMSQCIQQAYSDTRHQISDPDFQPTRWRELLTGKHTRAAKRGISIDSHAEARLPVAPPADTGNTTHLSVIDEDGNAVSITQSINYFFGTGRMAPGTGIILNNQMKDFSIPNEVEDPTTPADTLNLLAGGKRPRSNMAPTMVLKDGRPVLIIGTPGGSRIVSTLAQIVSNVLAYELDISEAIDYPRYFPFQNHLVHETRIPVTPRKRLKKLGYILHPAGPYHNYFGGAHGIAIARAAPKLYGAADRRRGGAARGY